MTDQQQPDRNPKDHPTGNAEKDPDDWTTGGEAMTGAQASYLKTLSEEAHEQFDETLTKADASKSLLGNARKSAFRGGAGPLPLPATHSGYAVGGREGERAGTAKRAAARFQTDSKRIDALQAKTGRGAA